MSESAATQGETVIIVAQDLVNISETSPKTGDDINTEEVIETRLLQENFIENAVTTTENESAIQKEEEATKEPSEEKRQLNQEDIDAVEFLASEFSKEIQTTKPNEEKPQEIETIDSCMLEVAAVAGVSEKTESTDQETIVEELGPDFEDSTEIDQGEVLEPATKRRRSKGDEREFKCGFCAKSFSMRIALEKHLVVHGAKLPWQCPDCAKGFMKSSDYKDHCNKIHENYRPFPCHVCGKALSNLGILKNHQGLHSGERPFQCNYPNCTKAFLTKTNLEDHHRKHVNAREYECETCHKRFNLKGDLRQHEKVHRQEKPFECEFCKMTFPRGPSLWRHRRTHTGEKPFACDICGKCFARMENCQEHRRIHTGERPLVCSVCGKSFRDSGNFSNHKKIHQDGYVPRKKRAVSQKKSVKELILVPKDSSAPTEEGTSTEPGEDTVAADIASQEVAFIVAPMQIDEVSSGIDLTDTATTTEPSYVQVGNFLLTMEMEAAFKQLMQQHAGSNEIVTLAMTDGKGLELVSDPSQFGAIMQAATMQTQQSITDPNADISQQSEKENQVVVTSPDPIESTDTDPVAGTSSDPDPVVKACLDPAPDSLDRSTSDPVENTNTGQDLIARLSSDPVNATTTDPDHVAGTTSDPNSVAIPEPGPIAGTYSNPDQVAGTGPGVSESTNLEIRLVLEADNQSLKAKEEEGGAMSASNNDNKPQEESSVPTSCAGADEGHVNVEKDQDTAEQ